MAAKRKSSSGSGAGKFLLGFVCAAALCGGAWWWLHHKDAHKIRIADDATSTAESPRPAARKVSPGIASVPEGMGPVAGMPKQDVPEPGFSPSEDAYETGARVYRKRCAGCHGSPVRDGAAGLALQPPAPQLWRAGAAALAVKQPGAIYLAIRDGQPKAGMPSYKGVLADSELWDLALLLKQANEPLPEPVTVTLNSR